MKALIEEANSAHEKKEGSENLAGYLDKIVEIVNGENLKDETYESFHKRYQRTYDFNFNVIKLEINT